MKICKIIFILCLLIPVQLSGQVKGDSDKVWIDINDSLYAISPVQTQTQIKPGWKIADVAQTKSKKVRYIWGKNSRQMADTNRPTFVVKVTDGTLHDFVFVKLKEKKEYRQFKKSQIADCSPLYIDLHTFRIELRKDDRYAITPEQPLAKGEYVIIDTSAKPVNEYGDIICYGFTVQ